MFTDATAETPSKEAVEKREDSDEGQRGGSEGTTEGPRPQAVPEPRQKSSMVENSQASGEDTATNTQPPASLPNQEHRDPQATGDSERGLSAQQQAINTKQEEEEHKEVREKAGPEEAPTATSSSRSQTEYQEFQKDEGMYSDRTSLMCLGEGWPYATSITTLKDGCPLHCPGEQAQRGHIICLRLNS